MNFQYCSQCRRSDSKTIVCNLCVEGSHFDKKDKVILLMASTVDGKITKHKSDKIDWTGKADRKYFVDLTKDAGVVIMGSKTYDTIGKPLVDRFNVVMTKDTSRKSDAFNLSFTNKEPKEVISSLRSSGYHDICLIGGSTINSAFIADGLIDELQFVFIPKLYGCGLSAFTHNINISLEYKGSTILDDNYVLIKYRVLK